MTPGDDPIHRVLWGLYRRAHATVQRAIAATILVAGLAVAGLPVAPFAAIAVVLIVVTHRKITEPWSPPAQDQLDRIDAARAIEDADEHAESGAGEEAWDQALSMMFALLGKHISVTFGAGGAAWRPFVMATGVLQGGEPDWEDSAATPYEVLVFDIGDRVAFHLDREQITALGAQVVRNATGFTITGADGTVIQVMHETAALNGS